MSGEGGDRELEVLERVRAIPEGFVSTYGDVSPGAPRFAGSVLFEVDEPELPWWRVVRADGSLAKGARLPDSSTRNEGGAAARTASKAAQQPIATSHPPKISLG